MVVQADAETVKLYDLPMGSNAYTKDHDGCPRLTTAEVLRQTVRSGALAQIVTQKKNRNSKSLKLILGKFTSSQLKSVTSNRKIELFISRLSPDVSESIVCDSVSAIVIDDSNLTVNNINCVKLDTEYHSYASFHVSLTVKVVNFDNILKCLMDPDMWLLGIIVHRFYTQTKRHG